MGGGGASKMGGGNNILIPTKGFSIFSNGIVGRKAKNKKATSSLCRGTELYLSGWLLFVGWGGGGGGGTDTGLTGGREEGAWNMWRDGECAGDGQHNVILISQAYYVLHYL
jgi:hypothetical protein